MKMWSWNVNGIRAILKNGFPDAVKAANPAILCLQETKAHPDQVDAILAQYPHQFWNSAQKKGYSGTAIFSKLQPLEVSYGIGQSEHDQEGRVITAEFPDFFLVNVYTPNVQRDLARLPYRIRWDREFQKYLGQLEKRKAVIFCGDLNVAHTEIDLANPKSNVGNAGFTHEERAGFAEYLQTGFIDSFRAFNQQGGHYSWWSYMFQARQKNIGWRIDYFCVSSKLKDRLKAARIHPEVTGSDHCPVELTLG